MALQNRVLPTGEIIAHTARAGTFTGNRGILHDAAKRLGTARWRHRNWIVCVLHLPGRPPRVPMTPGRWTELFFLDEAVALSAGHRPCAFCRRPAWLSFRDAWAGAALPGRRADAIDSVLHEARIAPERVQRRHPAEASALPDGVFVLAHDRPLLILGGAAFAFAPDGYGPPLPRPEGVVEVLTPAPTVAVLRAGYRPVLHPSLSRG